MQEPQEVRNDAPMFARASQSAKVSFGLDQPQVLDPHTPACVTESGLLPELERGFVVDVDVGCESVVPSQLAAVFLDPLDGELPETSPSVERADVELVDAVRHADVLQETEADRLVVVEDEERGAVGVLPVEVEAGIMVPPAAALLAVVQRELLGILLVELPDSLLSLLRRYDDLDHYMTSSLRDTADVVCLRR